MTSSERLWPISSRGVLEKILQGWHPNDVEKVPAAWKKGPASNLPNILSLWFSCFPSEATVVWSSEPSRMGTRQCQKGCSTFHWNPWTRWLCGPNKSILAIHVSAIFFQCFSVQNLTYIFQNRSHTLLGWIRDAVSEKSRLPEPASVIGVLDQWSSEADITI